MSAICRDCLILTNITQWPKTSVLRSSRSCWSLITERRNMIIIIITSWGAHLALPLLHPFCMNISSCSYTHYMRYHVSIAVKGQTLLLRRSHSKGEFVGHWWTCKWYTHDALYNIVVHAHLLHPVQARDLINQLVTAVSSTACVKQRNKEQNTWRWPLQYLPLNQAA